MNCNCIQCGTVSSCIRWVPLCFLCSIFRLNLKYCVVVSVLFALRPCSKTKSTSSLTLLLTYVVFLFFGQPSTPHKRKDEATKQHKSRQQHCCTGTLYFLQMLTVQSQRMISITKHQTALQNEEEEGISSNTKRIHSSITLPLLAYKIQEKDKIWRTNFNLPFKGYKSPNKI